MNMIQKSEAIRMVSEKGFRMAALKWQSVSAMDMILIPLVSRR